MKAFIAVLAEHLETLKLGDQPLMALVAGDDTGVKTRVLGLARASAFGQTTRRHRDPCSWVTVRLPERGVDPRATLCTGDVLFGIRVETVRSLVAAVLGEPLGKVVG